MPAGRLLVPVRAALLPLLQALGLDKADAWMIPQGLPLRTVEFFQDGKLELDDLEKWLKEVLGEPLDQAFALPEPFEQAVEVVGGSIVNRLPDRFKEYLNLILPPNFSFAIEVTADGSFSLRAEVAPPDYLQLLLPDVGILGSGGGRAAGRRASEFRRVPAFNVFPVLHDVGVSSCCTSRHPRRNARRARASIDCAAVTPVPRRSAISSTDSPSRYFHSSALP